MFWYWEELNGHRIPRPVKAVETVLKIDPIECAASIDMTSLKSLALTLTAVWVGLWLGVMYPSELVGWCGWNGQSGHPLTSQTCYSASFEELVRYGVLETHLQFSWMARTFFKLFLVPKTSELARVIMDCRQLDRLCARPPAVRFATLIEIFAIIGHFQRPVFGVLDFRHFFYEIRIPLVARRLFSAMCATGLYTATVLPMGFAWSPWIAQCLATILIIESVRRCGYAIDIDPEATSPPPVLVVRNSADRIIALIFIWYDNITLTATNTAVRDAITKQIKLVCELYSCIIKTPGIVHTKLGASFLGMDVRRRGELVEWRHDAANCEKWQMKLDTFTERAKDLTLLTPREVAEIVGIIVWHWQLEGTSIDSISHVLKISSKIGEVCKSRKAWDLRSLNGVIDKGEIETLLSSMTRILARENGCTENMWRIRVRVAVTNLNTHNVFLASDAMNVRAAGVRWDTAGKCMVTWCEDWDAEDVLEHINWKETHAMVRTIMIELQGNRIPNDTGYCRRRGQHNGPFLFATLELPGLSNPQHDDHHIGTHATTTKHWFPTNSRPRPPDGSRGTIEVR